MPDGSRASNGLIEHVRTQFIEADNATPPFETNRPISMTLQRRVYEKGRYDSVLDISGPAPSVPKVLKTIGVLFAVAALVAVVGSNLVSPALATWEKTRTAEAVAQQKARSAEVAAGTTRLQMQLQAQATADRERTKRLGMQQQYELKLATPQEAAGEAQAAGAGAPQAVGSRTQAAADAPVFTQRRASRPPLDGLF